MPDTNHSTGFKYQSYHFLPHQYCYYSGSPLWNKCNNEPSPLSNIRTRTSDSRPQASGLRHRGKGPSRTEEETYSFITVQWKHPPFRGNKGQQAWKPGGPQSKASPSASIQAYRREKSCVTGFNYRFKVANGRPAAAKGGPCRCMFTNNSHTSLPYSVTIQTHKGQVVAVHDPHSITVPNSASFCPLIYLSSNGFCLCLSRRRLQSRWRSWRKAQSYCHFTFKRAHWAKPFRSPTGNFCTTGCS